MPICYLLPGFAGSSLSFPPPVSEVLWVNFSRLFFGEVSKLRLAADGTSPAPGDGARLLADGFVPPYYGQWFLALKSQLKTAGYSVEFFPFDWRKQSLLAGQLLAQQIREQVLPTDPCAIVAHSQGGLVARRAWSELLASGEQGLVRRIVTLGTPHYGTYAPIEVLSLGGPVIDQLSQYSTLRRTTTPWQGAYTKPELARLFASFPAVYELFPVPGAPGSGSDTVRPELFDADNWPADRGVSAAWLAEAAGSFRTWLLSAASLPPPWVLTCVIGYGGGTKIGFPSVADIGEEDALQESTEGDGTVSEQSAGLVGYPFYRTACRHFDLPEQLALSGDLVDLVTEVRTPPPPPPPPPPAPVPVTLPGLAHATYDGPPLPGMLVPIAGG